jgi:hypothetical protein
MYPLVPKSAKFLRPGQYWAIPMKTGLFACGRVLQVGASEIPTPTKAFFGALHSWVGTSPPNDQTELGSVLIQCGVMHIEAITQTGGAILGERPLRADKVQIPKLLSAMGGPDTHVLLGAEKQRIAKRTEWGTLPVLRFWGYDVIQELANAQLTAPVA